MTGERRSVGPTATARIDARHAAVRVLGLVLVLSLAWAHHPVDASLPDGTVLCVDDDTVQAVVTGAGGARMSAAEAQAVAATAGDLDRILGAFGRRSWRRVACAAAPAYLRIDLEGRLLDPQRYRGFDPATYSLTWTVRVGPYPALSGSWSGDDAMLLRASGADLHSEARTAEPVATRLVTEARALVTEVVHAAVTSGEPRLVRRVEGAIPTGLKVAAVGLAVTALAVGCGVLAMRRARARRRGAQGRTSSAHTPPE